MMKRFPSAASIAVAILLCACGVAPADTAPAETAPAKQVPALENTKEFDFPIQRGEYLFMGQESGRKGKSKYDLGTIPLVEIHVAPDAVSQQWNLHVAVQRSDNGDGTSGWLFGARVECGQGENPRKTQLKIRYQDASTTKQKVEMVSFEKVDASKDAGIKGFQIYRLPYGKIDGELRYLLVCIAKTTEPFKRSITIPQNYIFFKWDVEDRWIKVTDRNDSKPAATAP